MNDFTGRVRMDERTAPVGTVRTVTVALDTAQYQVGSGAGEAEPADHRFMHARWPAAADVDCLIYSLQLIHRLP